MPADRENSPDSNTDALLHDIRLHQLKLQLQNEELKKSQQELEKTRRRYIELFEQAPNSYITLDKFGRISSSNLEAKSVFMRKDLRGRPLTSLIVPADHRKFITAFNRTLINKTRETFEVQLIDPDEKIRIFRCTTTHNHFASSEKDVVLFSGIDCTERFLASNRVRSIIDCSPDAMIIFSESGEIVDANQQAERLFCSSKENLKNRHISDLLTENFRGKYGTRIMKIIRTHTKNSRVSLHKLKMTDAECRSFSAIAKISAIDSQFESLFVGSIRDISKERSAIKTAIRTRMAALRASKTKSQFLANMSHELRTPITSIMGFADLLVGELPNKESRKYLESIRKNSEHLRQVINDILDISSIESGKLKIKRKPCNIRELIAEAHETMRVSASEKKLSYNLIVSNAIPENLMIDTVRVKQILLNLIGNAVKFTDSGHVTVKADVSRANRDYPSLTISIDDSGCGIAPEHSDNLFNMFYQADSGNNRRYGGTGLGLAVSKNLAALMDGDVVLQHSHPNLGSSFILTLKLPELLENAKGPVGKNRRKTPTPVGEPLKGLRILVVEDGEDIQLLLKSYLRKAGAVVDQAINGLEGYEKAMAKPYDAVLMDIQMPIVDGHEAASMLRQKLYDKPIIAVSANAYPSDISRSLKSGCNDHISKPIQYETLVKKISHWTTHPTH